MVLRSALLPALAVFAAAARHQNFAHAADELHLTASAVSHHVRRLEAQLGVALFQRQARGVLLTPEGRQLADAATGAIGELEAVVATLRGARSRAAVRVSVLPSFASVWLVPRLVRFSRAHPHIRVLLDSDRGLTRFEDGGPDLGVRYGPGAWPGLAARHLLDDAMFPVAAPHLPGIENVQTPRDIATLPLIADLAMEGWREWFRSADTRRLRLPEAHSVSDSRDALVAAAAGFGAALARRTLAREMLASGTLIRLPGPAMKTRFSYYVVYPAHRALSAPAQAFAAWLEDEARRDAENDSEFFA